MRSPVRPLTAAIVLLAALPTSLLACGDDTSGDSDAAVVDGASTIDGPAIIDASTGPDGNPLRPGTLEESGLYSDFAHEVLADGVRPFRPAYQLWSDGATKRRWIYLPPGTQIDTSNMDYWVYPVGTKLWKEFTRDGVRVETRLLFKTAPDTWYKVAYAWNQEQTEAIAATGPVVDALGTGHDIPSRSACNKCHDRGGDVAIGFTGLLLDHAPYDDLDNQVTLDTLIADELLTVRPTGDSAPHFPIPGTPVVRDALGYLHANCGNCHNPTSDVQDKFTNPIVMRLEVAGLTPGAAPGATPTYQTMVGIPAELQAGNATARIAPCDPDHSAVRLRMLSRGAIGMPPVGSELVDDNGLGVVTAWINALPCQ